MWWVPSGRGTLIGAAVAFFGIDHLHSHITGVDPATQSRGVGFALKLHQRAWALDRRIESVHWTFDPLVGRNAYFNLHKLGARAIEYLPDFYGRMTDGINGGDATSDRLYSSGTSASPEAVAAAAGDPGTSTCRRCTPPALGGPRPRRLRPPEPGQRRCATAGRCWSPCRPTSRRCGAPTRRAPSLAEGGRRRCARAVEAGYRIAGIARDGWYVHGS